MCIRDRLSVSFIGTDGWVSRALGQGPWANSAGRASHCKPLQAASLLPAKRCFLAEVRRGGGA
eukprot:8461228-Alexandrium_andersonii.AAC.1